MNFGHRKRAFAGSNPVSATRTKYSPNGGYLFFYKSFFKIQRDSRPHSHTLTERVITRAFLREIFSAEKIRAFLNGNFIFEAETISVIENIAQKMVFVLIFKKKVLYYIMYIKIP